MDTEGASAMRQISGTCEEILDQMAEILNEQADRILALEDKLIAHRVITKGLVAHLIGTRIVGEAAWNDAVYHIADEMQASAESDADAETASRFSCMSEYALNYLINDSPVPRLHVIEGGKAQRAGEQVLESS